MFREGEGVQQEWGSATEAVVDHSIPASPRQGPYGACERSRYGHPSLCSGPYILDQGRQTPHRWYPACMAQAESTTRYSVKKNSTHHLVKTPGCQALIALHALNLRPLTLTRGNAGRRVRGSALTTKPWTFAPGTPWVRSAACALKECEWAIFEVAGLTSG